MSKARKKRNEKGDGKMRTKKKEKGMGREREEKRKGRYVSKEGRKEKGGNSKGLVQLGKERVKKIRARRDSL